MSKKIEAGSNFPEITCKTLDNSTLKLGKPVAEKTDWQLLIVYRGKHCPLCTKYLNSIEEYKERLLENKVDLAAVSADSKAQLEEHLKKLEISFPIAYGITIDQMKELGLYISRPRSEQETDHPFAEPGLFVINSQNQVQVVDVSNNPFVRPELEPLVSGLEWIRNPENNYPIRGTYSYS